MAVAAILRWPRVPRRQCGGKVVRKSGLGEIGVGEHVIVDRSHPHDAVGARVAREGAQARHDAFGARDVELALGTHEIELRVHVPEH
jgi:hypothetical protein